MASRPFKDYVSGLPPATLIDKNTINYSQTLAGVSEKTTGAQTFSLVNPDNYVLVKDLDKDIGPAVNGFRDLAPNTHYRLGTSLVDSNIWRSPTSWVGKISSDSYVNNLTFTGSGGILVDGQFDIEIDNIQIFGFGSGIGIEAIGLDLGARMRIVGANIVNFPKPIKVSNAIYTIDRCEFNTFSSVGVHAVDCAINVSSCIFRNGSPQVGAIHYKFEVSSGSGQEIFNLNNNIFAAQTGEILFDIDPAIPNLSLISDCFSKLIVGSSPTIFNVNYTDDVTSVANNNGNPEITTLTAHSLSVGQWVILSGDIFYQGAYQILSTTTNTLTLNTPFNADTEANFAKVVQGSLDNTTRNLKINGGDLSPTIGIGTNRLSASANTSISSSGSYANMSGAFLGSDPVEGTNTMFRARTDGILQFAGKDGTWVQVKLEGATKAVGSVSQEVSAGFFLNGSSNFIAESESVFINSRFEIGFSTTFVVKLNFGDQLRPACTNHTGTNPVRNERGTKITAITIE